MDIYKKYKNKVGMCVTTGGFTFDAKETAKKAKIELFDGKKLLEMVEKKSKGSVNKKKKDDDDSWFW